MQIKILKKLKKKLYLVALLSFIIGLFMYLPIKGKTFATIVTENITSVLLGAEQHSNFTEVTIRKQSEYGPVVADILKGEVPIIDANTDYFITITAQSPVGTTDGYFDVKLGDGKTNGISYISIPGQKYTPGTIESDAFESLLLYEDLPDYRYGSGTNTYQVKDGELKYSIKESKMNNRELYFVFGIKLDDIAWNELEKQILNALQFEFGNSNGPTDTLTVNMNVNATKTLYISGYDNQINAIQNVMSTPIGLGLNSTNNSPMLYKELGYKVTYPKGAIYNGVSLSNTSLTSTTSGAYGVLSYSDEIDNGDGTLSRIVKIGPGKKEQSGISTLFYNYITFTDQLKPNSNYTFVMSDAYYIPMGSSEVINIPLGSYKTNKVTYTSKLFPADSSVDRTTLTEVNKTRYSAVYNWNIDRKTKELTDANVFMGGANLKNPDTVMTKYEKTVKANFNITNENVNITSAFVPVGVDENNVRLSKITIKYVAIDAQGNEFSGNYTTSSIWGSNVSRYTIIRAVDIGAVSIKSVEADIGHIPAGFYSSGWASSNAWGGNGFSAFGYFTDGTSGNRVKNTYVLINTKSDAPTNDLKATSIVESTNIARINGNVNFQNGETKISSLVVAGNSITLKNKDINVFYAQNGYYTNTTILVNPELYIMMPKGMSFSNLSINKNVTNNVESSRNGTFPLEITIDNISYLNEKEDGTSIYRVTFKDKNLVIGNNCNKYTDNVSLKMTVTLNTMKTMTTQVYDFNSLFNLSGESKNVIMRDYSQSKGQSLQVEDVYNVNGGRTLSGSRVWNAGVTGISVQRLDAITVENAISVSKIDGITVPEDTRTWDIYDETNQNSISYMGLNTEGQYRIIIQNPSSSEAKNFQMILPIPKAEEDLGKAFMKKESQFNMTFDIADAQDYTIKYIYIESTSDASTNFNNINYYETTQENANAILITKQTIKAFENKTLYFNFYVKKDNSVVAGAFNSWRNYFDYTLDGGEISNFGSYVAAEVAICEVKGNVFEDISNDSRKDLNEVGIEGVNITALDSFGRVQFAKTDANGNYLFENVREDDIKISMEITEGNYWFIGEKRANTPTYDYNNVEASEDPKKASADVHASGAEVKVNASVNKVYTITYNANKASGTAPNKQELPYGIKGTIATPPSGMILNGSEFIGWSKTAYDTADSNVDKVEYRPGDVIQLTEDITLYAVYKPKYYVLTFDYQGANPTVYDNNQKKNIPQYATKYIRTGYSFGTKDSNNLGWPTPTKDGYKFWKWELSDGEYGRGNAINTGTTVTTETDIMVRAVFLRLNKSEDAVTINYGDKTNNFFYSLFNELKTENLPAFYDYGMTFRLKDEQSLPAGLTLEDGDIKGTASEIFDGDVTFVVRTQTAPSTSSYMEFDFTLHISVVPRNINLSVNAEPTGGIVATSEAKPITLTATIDNLTDIKNPNENNTVTFIAFNKNNEKTLIGTANIVNGIATIDWNVTDADVGTYKITSKFDNLYPEYNVLNNSVIGSYVISNKELVKYTVTFDSNGYDINVPSQQIVEGAPIGELPSIKIEGYQFQGWYDTNDNKVSSDKIVNSDITLKAKYNAISYTVKYTSESATINLANKTNVKYNDTGLIQPNAPEISGYRFTGWTTKNAVKVTTATRYSELVPDENTLEITLYANYEPNEYEVTYNGNGGTVGVQSFKIKYEQLFGELQTPSRIGYNFLGWYDETNTKVNGQTKYTYPKNITLTAKWGYKTGYKIKFDSVGAGSFAELDANWNTNLSIVKYVPTKTGYIFGGWKYNDTLINDTDTYGNLAQNDKLESITLVASWEKIKKTITLNYQNYDSTVPNGSVQVGQYDEIGIIDPVAIPGSTFQGWYYDNKYQNIVYETDLVSKDITIYAKYTANKYTVKYVGRNKTIIIKNKENVLFKDKNLLPEKDFEIDGYSVIRYERENGLEVTNNNTYASLVDDDTVSEITLYAVYKVNTYKVSFDAKTGDSISTVKDVTYETAYGELPIPTVKGGTFKHWMDKNGNKVAEDTIYLIPSDSTLTAVYDYAKKYKVNFEMDGGDEITPIDVTWITKVQDLNVIPHKDGYGFRGWVVDGIKVDPTSYYGTIAKDETVEQITLTATWEINKYTITVLQGEGYTITSNDTKTPDHGGNFKFKLEILEGYEQTANFKVLVNNEEVKLNADGTYEITGITKDQVIKVQGVSKIIEKNPEKEPIINPETGDNITIYVVFFVISLIVVIATSVFLLKDKKER